MKKITFVTTTDHNVGDDFVREGIKYLLRRHYKNEELRFESIHKHSPITTRHGFEWFRYHRLSKHVDKALPLKLTRDKILEADVIVQSGAPVYWCHNVGGDHCSENEWFHPLLQRRLALNKNAILMNLAAGTCQKYNSDGSEFLLCKKDADYIRKLFRLSSVTTVRDALAKKVLYSLGLVAPLLPCSSIFAIDECGLKEEGDDYVVVNYMEGGGHYTFGQNIDHAKWKREFSKFYHEIKKFERVVFSCHNEAELRKAKEIDPDAEVYYSTDYLKYMKFFAKAKYGIMNRVHGSFLLASYGKPSVVIGSDTRAKMATEIGLNSYFVNDVDHEFLMTQYDLLRKMKDSYKDRFNLIKKKAFDDYMIALS